MARASFGGLALLAVGIAPTHAQDIKVIPAAQWELVTDRSASPAPVLFGEYGVETSLIGAICAQWDVSAWASPSRCSGLGLVKDACNQFEKGVAPVLVNQQSQHWRYLGPRRGHLEGQIDLRADGWAHPINAPAAGKAVGYAEYSSNTEGSTHAALKNSAAQTGTSKLLNVGYTTGLGGVSIDVVVGTGAYRHGDADRAMVKETKCTDEWIFTVATRVDLDLWANGRTYPLGWDMAEVKAAMDASVTGFVLLSDLDPKECKNK
jgi:hypothetical protein